MVCPRACVIFSIFCAFKYKFRLFSCLVLSLFYHFYFHFGLFSLSLPSLYIFHRFSWLPVPIITSLLALCLSDYNIFLAAVSFYCSWRFFPINAVCTQHNERPTEKKETDRIANCAIFTSQGLLSVNVFVPFFAFPYDQISLFFVPSLPSLFRCDCLSGIFCIEY